MRAIVAWCSLAVVGCLVGIVDSFTVGAPHLPSAPWVIPLVGFFPVAFLVAAKLLFRRGTESRGLVEGVKSLPRWVWWGAVVLVLAAGIVAAVAVAGLRTGTPEMTATGYQLYTRLGSTPITRAEYLRELAGSQRLFAALGFGLNALLAAIAMGAGAATHPGVEHAVVGHRVS
ncbi:hypothetical protein [Amycolatopsis sp. RTGN1]|uniref:hypothetical protein n=1 Tax=Amycolatopsis ponsaeliensis TaxID=2992142 RepID=UPI002550823B|nr:hypothetical protein [Amycolatopsis sp. RTGN1]